MAANPKKRAIFAPRSRGGNFAFSVRNLVKNSMITSAVAPANNRAGMLFLIPSMVAWSGSTKVPWSSKHVPGAGVGTNATTGASTPSRRRPLLTVAAMIGALLLAAAAIDVIEDATQSRRDVSHPSVSRVELRVVNGRSGPAEQTADALWTVCRTVLPASSRAVVAPGTSPSTVSLVVVPGLGEVARRRFTGCLEDATLDRVRADVVRFDDLG